MGEPSRVKGIIFSVVFAMVASIPWILVSSAGFFVSYLSFIIGIAAIKGYEWGAGKFEKIALGIASIALPLHHPVHVFKSATTIDQLSGGRIIMGIASGDRYEEYPAMNITYEDRGKMFREAYEYIRKLEDPFPQLEENQFGALTGQLDVLPKPKGHKIPMLITGNSRQSVEWIANNGDGWMYYPRNLYIQQNKIQEWRQMVDELDDYGKPFMQPLYIDLHQNDDFKPQGIHLGFRIGANYLVEYFHHLESIGVNHVALNMRFNSEKIEPSMERLAHKVLPYFNSDKLEKTKA